MINKSSLCRQAVDLLRKRICSDALLPGQRLDEAALAAGALVSAGAGIAVVDELVAGNLRRGLVVKPFRPQKVVRLYAVARPERLSLAAQALLDVLAPPGKARSRDGASGTSTPRAAKRPQSAH